MPNLEELKTKLKKVMNELLTTVEKVTRDMVRDIRKNRPLYVRLPNYAAILSARQTVTQVSALDGKTYTTNVNREDNTILVSLV